MNHLVHINSPFRVPYLCGDFPACERKTYEDYPATCGFDISNIRRGELDGRSEDEVAAFLQAWLFFGLMHVHFDLWGLRINDGDFVYEDGSQELITTESTLVTYLLYWTACVAHSKHVNDENVMGRVWAEHLSVASGVNDLINDIIRWRAKTFLARQGEGLDFPPLDSVILSIILLSEYLDDACMSIFDGGRPRQPHWELDNASRHLLLNASWCPGEIQFLHRRLERHTSLFLASSFDRRHLPKDHSRCSCEGCEANQVDSSSYEIRHVDALCPCELVGEKDEGHSQAAQILGEGAIPIIKIVKSGRLRSSVTVRIAVEKSQKAPDAGVKPYVAISHVWSDGLGNPHHNSLPRCQLRRLQNLVNGLYDERNWPVPFWIDTICVPLQEDSRKQAIRRMGQTYRDADKVLVLDTWLLGSTLSDYRELGFLRIKCCTWTQRLWTLQEAMIATVGGLYFQTAVGPVNEEDMYNVRRCGMWDLVDAYIGTEGDPLKEEHPDLTRHILEAADQLIAINGERIASIGKGDEESPVNRLVQRVKGWTEFNDVFSEGRSYLQGLRWPLRAARNRHTDNEILETNELMFVGHGMKDRSTSKLEDEPVCLATLLGYDVQELLAVKDVGERMRMVMSRLHLVSTGLLFSHAKRIEQDGYRWAPVSFMTGRKEYGLLLEQFPFASPDFLVDLGDVLLRIKIPRTGTTPQKPASKQKDYQLSVILQIKEKPIVTTGRLDGVLVWLKGERGDELVAEFLGNVYADPMRPEFSEPHDLRINCRPVEKGTWCVR